MLLEALHGIIGSQANVGNIAKGPGEGVEIWLFVTIMFIMIDYTKLHYPVYLWPFTILKGLRSRK